MPLLTVRDGAAMVRPAGCMAAVAAQAAGFLDHAALVNPFIGTASGGTTFPGAVVGGTLRFALGTEPAPAWASDPANAPPSFPPR